MVITFCKSTYTTHNDLEIFKKVTSLEIGETTVIVVIKFDKYSQHT